MTEPQEKQTVVGAALLSPATLLDGAGRVAADVLCTCGYNLRTLPASGLCPECAAPVATSLERYGETPWQKSVRRALYALRIVTALQVTGSMLFILGAGISGINESGGGFVCIVAIIPLVAAGLTTMLRPMFIWMLTAPLPSGHLRGSRFHARQPARLLLVIAVTGTLLSVFYFSEWDPISTPMCGLILGIGLFFPAVAARHVADIVRAFGAARAARSIESLSLAISLLYPLTWFLVVLSAVWFALTPPLAVSGLCLAMLGSCLSFLGLNDACQALAATGTRPRGVGGLDEFKPNG